MYHKHSDIRKLACEKLMEKVKDKSIADTFKTLPLMKAFCSEAYWNDLEIKEEPVLIGSRWYIGEWDSQNDIPAGFGIEVFL